ncbi:hypothetical protein, partial [Sessilibacter sp. MAH3]
LPSTWDAHYTQLLVLGKYFFQVFFVALFILKITSKFARTLSLESLILRTKTFYLGSFENPFNKWLSFSSWTRGRALYATFHSWQALYSSSFRWAFLLKNHIENCQNLA